MDCLLLTGRGRQGGWRKVCYEWLLRNEEGVPRSFRPVRCSTLGEVSIFQTSGICKDGEERIAVQKFLEVYREYVKCLKAGILPEENVYQLYFSGVVTVTEEAVFSIPVAPGQSVVRVRHPVIQMRNHRFDYSEVDHQYRSMVFGQESVLWGIQFSYPQIFQDQVTKDVRQVGDTAEFPNTKLFRTLQKWVRDNTVATPLVAHGIRTNVPIRLGKACFSWINIHPQLMKKELKVVDYGKPQC